MNEPSAIDSAQSSSALIAGPVFFRFLSLLPLSLSYQSTFRLLVIANASARADRINPLPFVMRFLCIGVLIKS